MTSIFLHGPWSWPSVIDKRGELVLLREGAHRQYSTIAYRAQQEAGVGRDRGSRGGRHRTETGEQPTVSGRRGLKDACARDES